MTLNIRTGSMCNTTDCVEPGLFTVVTRSSASTATGPSRYADPVCAKHVIKYLVGLAGGEPSVEAIRAFDPAHGLGGGYTVVTPDHALVGLGEGLIEMVKVRDKVAAQKGLSPLTVTGSILGPVLGPSVEVEASQTLTPVAWEPSARSAGCTFRSPWPTALKTRCSNCTVAWEDHAEPKPALPGAPSIDLGVGVET